MENVVTITHDFETRSACDLKKAGAWVYSEHPTTEILVLWFCWEDGSTEKWKPGMPEPAWLRFAIDSGTVFEAHNALFERGIWTNILVKQYGWPEIPPEQWHDTLAVCARKSLPLDLDSVSRLLGLDTVKDTEGSKALMKICKPISKKKFEFNEDPELHAIVERYGETDTKAQSALSKRLGYLEPVERQVWLLNQRMNLRGMQIDLEFAADCQAVYDKAAAPLRSVFSELTGDLKPGSPKLKELINRQLPKDLQLPNLQKETIKEALVEYDLPDDVRTILELKGALASASVKKLAAMRNCTSADGRARGLIQYHAATTGRDGGRLLQPQNFPRGTVEFGKDLDGRDVPPADFLIPAIQSRNAEFIGECLAHMETHISPEYRHLLAPVSAVTSSLRSCLVSGPGRLIVAGDFSTIEVRVLLGLAEQRDVLDAMKNDPTYDPYCDLASKVLGRTITKEHNKKERQEIGKPGVLGLGFQMGAKKFLSQYGQKDWDADFAQRMVDIYRKEWAPKVVELWYGLQEASTKAVYDRRPVSYNCLEYRLEDEWLTCMLPSGRKLYYFRPQKVTREMPWSTEDKPDFRQGWTYLSMKQGRLTKVDAYGGLLAENVTQGTARDILYDRGLVADAEGFPLVLTVHDENVTEPLEKEANPDTLQEIMEAVPSWVRQLCIPVAAECWVGDRYRK